MFVICLAELNIAIENKYDYIKAMCRDYITYNKADFCVSASDEEIQAEDKGTGFDRGYLESLAIYRKIAEKILDYNGFLMHGVVLDADGCGIAFLAKSGVGKSTHTNLWKQLLGDKMTVINGDKPLVRIAGDTVFAYGTPWAGKENIHTNTKTILKKICFIERSENNECLEIGKDAVLERLINQIYIPKNGTGLYLTLEYIKLLIEKCDFYLIKCNTEISAAKTAYEVITK
ncbi:MAG: hypothetical protein IJY55_02900 [Clostridia bacterium]|nr:hypothetical protein [Clostridia bacterium]